MSETLPEMSRQEASWHEHLAGMRAAAKARKQGCNPAATDALATVTLPPVTIGGFVLEPAAEGTVWTLKRAAREFRAWADALGMPRAGDDEELGTREMLELGISTLIFCDARECWALLEGGKLEVLITRAEDLMWATPVETLRELEHHFRVNMDRIRGITPEEEPAPGK